MRIGYTCRLFHLFACCAFHTECDIVEECIVEKYRFLIHIPHQATQVYQAHIPDVGPV